MKSVDKRLENLELTIPDKQLMTSLGELYEWQNTPEGKAELNNLYNENRYDESE